LAERAVDSPRKKRLKRSRASTPIIRICRGPDRSPRRIGSPAALKS